MAATGSMHKASAELEDLYAWREGGSEVRVRAGRITLARAPSLFATAYVPRDAAAGVVVCPPFGTEGELSRRTLHDLGLALARRGLFALTPHLVGQGQSEGDLRQIRCERWCEDLAGCTEVVAAATGGRKLALVGARFGAVLAILVARRAPIGGIVLWDPPLDVAGTFRASERAARIRERLRTGPDERMGSGADVRSCVEVEGHIVGRAFWREALALEWDTLQGPWEAPPLLVGLATSATPRARDEVVRRVRAVLPQGVFETFDPPEGHARYWSRIGVARQTGLVDWTAETLARL